MMFELPDEPTNEQILDAYRVMKGGGSVGGNSGFGIAIARSLNNLGHDTTDRHGRVYFERVQTVLAANQNPSNEEQS